MVLQGALVVVYQSAHVGTVLAHSRIGRLRDSLDQCTNRLFDLKVQISVEPLGAHVEDKVWMACGVRCGAVRCGAVVSEVASEVVG